ncbi:putative PEP-binding protein [Streptomyces sp. NPDC029216]|uniref:putative PEP-binding protein n=1 Tax=Streptomyces sp. NPDC029216 TaxID=3154701 RepID=UPI0033CFC18B
MIPFCRTLLEADEALDVMAAEGLRWGESGLKVYVMAEIPANISLAQDFGERFDGFSISSNDLTQLTLGVDRDSEALADVFDENAPAFAAFLVGVGVGIDSISVAPTASLPFEQHVAAGEERRYGEGRTAPAESRMAQADKRPPARQ